MTFYCFSILPLIIIFRHHSAPASAPILLFYGSALLCALLLRYYTSYEDSSKASSLSPQLPCRSKQLDSFPGGISSVQTLHQRSRIIIPTTLKSASWIEVEINDVTDERIQTWNLTSQSWRKTKKEKNDEAAKNRIINFVCLCAGMENVFSLVPSGLTGEEAAGREIH